MGLACAIFSRSRPHPVLILSLIVVDLLGDLDDLIFLAVPQSETRIMNPEFVVLVGIFVICNTIRAADELLKKSGTITEENKHAFIIVLIAMISLCVSWFGMCSVDPFQIDLPAYVKVTGLALFLVGLGLATTTFIQLKAVEHTDHLVTTGPFAITRHPTNLGFVFWIIGWHAAALSLAPGVLAIGNIIFWARLEDERLLAQYGKMYQQYRKETLF